MRWSAADARTLFRDASVARLATVRPDGRPHLVPVTFALIDVGDLAADPGGEAVVFAVDHKPKSTAALQRLENIDREPRVSLLVDRYEADWARLWWVRADAEAARAIGEERERAIAALVAKYSQYRATPPRDAVVSCAVQRWSGWAAADLKRS
jgi:PPOX class probable F420-dependent enzyme